MTTVTQDRIDVIRIARLVWSEELTFVAGMSELEPFAAGMDEAERDTRLRALIDEIDRLFDLASTEYGNSQAERDQLIAGAEALVNTAADALIGETS